MVLDLTQWEQIHEGSLEIDSKYVEIAQQCNVAALRMRRFALQMGLAAGPVGSHLGGSLSLMEILAVLYFGIKLVGLTSGLSAGILGATHMSIEDIAIMRAIPNITVLSPADCTETVKATLAAAQYEGPVYLRLTGGMNNPPVYKADYVFEIGKAIRLREGEDIAIIATGTMVHPSIEAAKLLFEQGVSCTVIDMHTIKPLDEKTVLEMLSAKLLVTVEEHNVKGGLGGAVSECLAGIRHKPPQLILGISDEFKKAADYPCLLDRYGLTAPRIAKSILEKYEEVK